MIDGFYIMAYRQIIKFFRARSRIIGSIVNPLIWLGFFGLGWANVFSFPLAKEIFGGVDYLTFLAPGILGMTVFTSSFISGISIIWDKQFGFMKEVLVAPSSRIAAMAGRLFGDSLTTLLQGAIILGFMYPLATSLKPYGALPSFLLAFLASVAFSSLGVIIALKMRSLEGFQLIINFLMIPLLFLSGAFYPINTMPLWMKVLAYLDPLTYGVDGMRYYLAGTSAFTPLLDWIMLAALATGLLLIASAIFRRATIE